jgi:hypothetical protein
MRLHYGGLENGENNRDWSSSMEGRFWHLVFLKLSVFLFLFEKLSQWEYKL